MWVSATILNAHTQEDSGVHGYDTAPWTWICTINRTLEAEWLPEEACSLCHRALCRWSCWWQGCSELLVLLPNHPLFALALSPSPVLTLSFCQMYPVSYIFSFLPVLPQILSHALFKKPQFPLKRFSSRIILSPQTPRPRNPKLFCPTLLHWKPGKKDLNGLPGSLAWRQHPHVFTFKPCFSHPETMFKSSFSMVMKLYKLLQRVEFRWCNHFIFSTMYF